MEQIFQMNEIIKQKILEARERFDRTGSFYAAPISPDSHREAKTPSNVRTTKPRDIDPDEESGNGVAE